MAIRERKLIWMAPCILLLIANLACRAEDQDGEMIAGTIHFRDGKTLDFIDVTSLIFTMNEGEESVPRHVKEWTKHYGKLSMSTSIPLAWVKSIEILSFETKNHYLCLYNPAVSITNIHGVTFQSEYKYLEWIRVKIKDADTGDISERYVYFVENNDMNIHRIVFNN